MVDAYMEFNSMFQASYSRQLEINSIYRLPMTWDERLREAFAETGWTKMELSRRSKVTYDNVTKYLDGKVKQPRGDVLERLAGALSLDPVFLATGVNPITGDTSIALMGYVGAGAEVEPDFEQVPPEGLDQVVVPFILPEEMIAFKVKGDSMLPQFKADTVIIVYREQRRAIETFYGEEAAVRTADGRRFIKTINRGGPRSVNLVSWNSATIEDVRLEWIGEIFAVLPPAAIKRANRAGGIQGQLRLGSG